MPTLELTTEESVTIREVLETAASDLGMEIAATDSLEYRNRLKNRREVLQRVIQSLAAAGSTQR